MYIFRTWWLKWNRRIGTSDPCSVNVPPPAPMRWIPFPRHESLAPDLSWNRAGSPQFALVRI